MKFLKKVNFGVVLFVLIFLFIIIFTVVTSIGRDRDEAEIKSVAAEFFDKCVSYYNVDYTKFAEENSLQKYIEDAKADLSGYFEGEPTLSEFDNTLRQLAYSNSSVTIDESSYEVVSLEGDTALLRAHYSVSLEHFSGMVNSNFEYQGWSSTFYMIKTANGWAIEIWKGGY